MPQAFAIGCHHYNHAAIVTGPFLRENGHPLRPFKTVEEMNEYIVEKHNSVVGPNDQTYFLGDFCFHNRDLEVLGRMNGKKVLIKGNHDNLKAAQYLKYFKDIRASHLLGKEVLTHIPVHPMNLYKFRNIHAHIHEKIVMREIEADTGIGVFPEMVPDERYFNVCVEQIDYTPMAIEEIRKVWK